MARPASSAHGSQGSTPRRRPSQVDPVS
jgi:hypothetical protein